MKYTISILAVLICASNTFLFAGNNTSKKRILSAEICDNRIDDDGDGLIDCLDPDCSGSETCWECVTEFYQIHSNKYLVSLDPYTGAYTTLGTISGVTKINGAQFNTIDGHVYAPIEINGAYKLGMLSQDGTVTDTGLELPGSNFFYVGAIDEDGIMFISGGSGIHSIDLKAENLEVNALGIANPGVADFALDITNGLFYGISSSAKLKVFNPFQNTVTSYDLAGSINNDSGAFGACWSSNDGSFFAYNNSSGKIYTIDPLALTATQVLNGTGNLTINDGFNCVLAPPPFESNCGNGIDDDNDGLADCDDQDCYASNKCTLEICFNGIDDDNDGWIDCNDSECFDLELCVEICGNGIDDNNNGLIDSEDPQCTSPSGVYGGLESNRRLSDKIAKRNFEIHVKDSQLLHEKKEGLIPFGYSQKRSPFDIENFIPTNVLDAYVAESAPIDIIDITNATDVAGADYYKNNRRIATVLGIYSENGVYEHTKYICDRLDGSRLLDISYLFAKGGNFISYELLNKNGQKEYAVSFAATYDQNNGFTIENHWNLHKYKSGSDYYNFQIWANSYAEMIVLLERILDNMSSKAKIARIEHSAIPRVFVMQGGYKNGLLTLSIRNKSYAKEIKFRASLRREENGELEDIEFNLDLSGGSEEMVRIETGYIYDLGASISSKDGPDDEIFLADGSWGIEENNINASVSSFNIEKETSVAEENTYMVERSVSVTAMVKDYLNVYRTLDAKLNPIDLSTYENLHFFASGTGNLEVTLVKKGISEWKNQYRSTINLSDNKTEVILPFNKFISNLGDDFTADDVIMIVFTLIGDNINLEQKQVNIEKLKFRNGGLSSSTSKLSRSISKFYPNPVSSHAILYVEGKESGIFRLRILNVLGEQIFSKEISKSMESNEIEVELKGLPSGTYYYKLEKPDFTYSGSFVKI